MLCPIDVESSSRIESKQQGLCFPPVAKDDVGCNLHRRRGTAERKRERALIIAGASSYVIVKPNCVSTASLEEAAMMTPIDALV